MSPSRTAPPEQHSSSPLTATPHPADQPDLLRRLRSDDAGTRDAAFDELVRAAGPRMLAVARRMLRSNDDAQDAVQEAFLSAFKSLDRFDGFGRDGRDVQLTTWLHRIAVNACLMKLRSARRRRARTAGDSIEHLLPAFLPDGHAAAPDAPWPRTDATDPVAREELLAHVRASIDQLPDPYREVIMLRDIAGLDTQAVAEVLDLSTAAVKTRLHRARQALKTLLDPHLR